MVIFIVKRQKLSFAKQNFLSPSSVEMEKLAPVYLLHVTSVKSTGILSEKVVLLP